jgi:hypothetical protein
VRSPWPEHALLRRPLPKFQSIIWPRAGTAAPPSETFPAPILHRPMQLALDLPACSRLRSARHMLGQVLLDAEW